MALTHNPSIVTNGLVACLDAANPKSYPGSGTAWRDTTGGLMNGTLTNGPTYNSANGGYITFDSIDDYVDLGSPTNLYNNLSTNRVSVNVWYRHGAATGVAQKIIFDSGALEYIQMDIYIDAVGFLVSTATSGYVRARATSTFAVGSWYNVCGVYYGSNVIVYINSVFNQQSAATGNLSTESSNYVAIGRQPTAGYFLNGSVAFLSIYNTALTAAQIAQNFNAQRGRFGI